MPDAKQRDVMFLICQFFKFQQNVIHFWMIKIRKHSRIFSVCSFICGTLVANTIRVTAVITLLISIAYSTRALLRLEMTMNLFGGRGGRGGREGGRRGREGREGRDGGGREGGRVGEGREG